MKKRSGPTKWTPPVIESLYQLWGMYTAEKVAARLTTTYGKTFTPWACMQRACLLGLSCETAQPYVSMADGARELGIGYRRLLRHCHKNKLKLVGMGYLTYLSDEAWATVQADFKTPLEPTLGVTATAARLNYTVSAISVNVRLGRMRGYKFGGRWLIPLAEVERIEREQRGARFIGQKEAS
ncbi:MAG: hypothetical protein PHS14_21220 [Elusimicrobia bacterium]|nr:hypothetical protein [Elusimicrobiota bacterium]